VDTGCSEVGEVHELVNGGLFVVEDVEAALGLDLEVLDDGGSEAVDS